MDDKYSQVAPDAIAYNLPSNTIEEPSDAIYSIINELSVEDYRSIFFLLLDRVIGINEFLYFITKDKNYLEEIFLQKYNGFQFKEAMLIEILGTMQKFKLLTLLKTCEHVFQSEKKLFGHLHPLWKCLYSVCEQLSDAQVTNLKRKLLPKSSIKIICAEHLFCEALQANVFEKNDLTKLSDIFENDHPECYNLIKSYKNEPNLSFYHIKKPTKESPCGLAVIVCQQKFIPENDSCPVLSGRPENSDARDLGKLWSSFGFKTKLYINLTDREVMELFQTLSELDHTSYDAFVACLLSHGDKGVVYGSNCQPISVTKLVDVMANNCSTLVCKPKLFFVQACQGNKVQQGVLNYTIEKECISNNGIDISHSKLCMDTPIFADVLLVVSSIERYASYCSPGGNSWFIGELVRVMQADGEHLTISNIITIVTDGVARKTGVTADEEYKNCKQIPVRNSTLRHELILKKIR